MLLSYEFIYLISLQGIWSDDVESWTDCNSLHACVTKYLL